MQPAHQQALRERMSEREEMRLPSLHADQLQ